MCRTLPVHRYPDVCCPCRVCGESRFISSHVDLCMDFPGPQHNMKSWLHRFLLRPAHHLRPSRHSPTKVAMVVRGTIMRFAIPLAISSSLEDPRISSRNSSNSQTFQNPSPFALPQTRAHIHKPGLTSSSTLTTYCRPLLLLLQHSREVHRALLEGDRFGGGIESAKQFYSRHGASSCVPTFIFGQQLSPSPL